MPKGLELSIGVEPGPVTGVQIPNDLNGMARSNDDLLSTSFNTTVAMRHQWFAPASDQLKPFRVVCSYVRLSENMSFACASTAEAAAADIADVRTTILWA